LCLCVLHLADSNDQRAAALPDLDNDASHGSGSAHLCWQCIVLYSNIRHRHFVHILSAQEAFSPGINLESFNRWYVRCQSEGDCIFLTLHADWINSLDNTISGAYALASGRRVNIFDDGIGCTVNGYVGQFSVQAIDFNILIISISVLITVRKKRFMVEPTLGKMIAVCALAWVPSIITSMYRSLILLNCDTDSL
jgi:hypothetical protein